MNNLSTALKLLAGVVLASIFLGVFIGIRTKFGRGSELNRFKKGSEEIANIIEGLGNQDPPSQKSYDLTVPEGCELRFENKSVIAVTNGTHSHGVGVAVIGQTLTQGEYHLKLVRTENGVKVNVEE